MECRKPSEQTAYPVFYDVEPTEIRKQSGAVEKAFEKHENKEAAEKWRKALNEAGNLAGWESKKTANGDESKLIQIIVDDIFQKICSSSSGVDGNLVGMETRIEALLSSLELDAPGVRMIGIWGMGGGGKTTLATTIFNQMCHQFEGSSFVDNVRECIQGGKKQDGADDARKKVRLLYLGKTLIATDQFEASLVNPNWYKPGSRIIITTRDEQVLIAHRVGFINNVTLLSHTEAIRLFNRYAFTKETPIQGHKELSRQVVKYAHGLPLTIKVLGSLLCGQNEPEWKDALERLKTIPLKETMKILEISYDALDDDYKEIFLDVACLLKGWRKDKAVIALESCGFHARNGLRVLEQRSLITISQYGKLGMHDHIEEMGKNIVRRVNPNKSETHSRLWIREEIEEILANDSGAIATKCIRKLNAHRLNIEMLMKGLANMKELKKVRGLLNKSPTSLENMRKHVRSSFRFALFLTLFNLHLRAKAYDADAYDADDADDADDAGRCDPGNTWLDFKFSCDYKEDPASSFGNLERLISLGFGARINADSFSDIICGLQCLRKLTLEGGIPEAPKNLDRLDCLKELSLRSTDIKTLPDSICMLKHLKYLKLESCLLLEKLPVDIGRLECLDLGNLKLMTLHLGITPNLKTLRLRDCTDMVELRMPAECPKLINLNLGNLKLTTLHLGITPNLETLRLRDCTDMVELRMPC
ncbi:Toll/interleukin-1 receptor domain-containing protein [Tanacetum coccineum]